jgi:PIN domain nuclease of toxin-antitoxin system
LTVLETHTSFDASALGVAAAETPAPTVERIVTTPRASTVRFTKVIDNLLDRAQLVTARQRTLDAEWSARQSVASNSKSGRLPGGRSGKAKDARTAFFSL